MHHIIVREDFRSLRDKLIEPHASLIWNDAPLGFGRNPDRDTCVLMNHDGTESLEVSQERFGADADLLQENLEGIVVLRYGDAILRVQLPNVVKLKVAETAPDERGDTSSGGGKQAVLNTGATIIVPFHIGVGDKIRVDTRSRQYLGRVSD